jgi:nucleoside-diphosphate-sugar epimerase
MVHVEDVASLIVKVGETQATGRYNAAAPQPLSIREWIAEIESTLNLQPVRCVRVPLAATHWLSAVLGYRLLAKEQLLMLAQDHVLSTVESVRLGWQPKHTNASIVRDIARYIVGTKKVKVDPPEVGPN